VAARALQVFDSLQQTTVSDEHLALLRPLHQRGARETKRQRLKWVLLACRPAGLLA
jgi:hypothetical protein